MAIIISMVIYTNRSITTAEIVRTIGLRIRDYRMRLNWTRNELSTQSGIGMTTLYGLETGRLKDVSFSVILKLLRSMGLENNWEQLMPELPESPYLYFNETKKRQRIRHPKS